MHRRVRTAVEKPCRALFDNAITILVEREIVRSTVHEDSEAIRFFYEVLAESGSRAVI